MVYSGSPSLSTKVCRLRCYEMRNIESGDVYHIHCWGYLASYN
jgi:hypothetical protein